MNRGEVTWEKREELVLIANNGSIMYPPIDDAGPETVVQYAYLYPGRRITFRGCTLNIRATEKTSVIWFLRADRSNAEICDFVIRPMSDAVITNQEFKGAIFTVKNAFNVTFRNIVGYNMAGKPADDSTTESRWATAFAGYIFHSGASAGIKIIDCYVTGWWGSMAFLFAKDIHVEHCAINRIDTHDYCQDMFIDNCIIGVTEGYVNMGYGHGTLTISNTKLHTYGERFLTLRSDYGSLFDGSIGLSNVSVDFTGTSRNFYMVDAKTGFSQEAFEANGNTAITKPKINIVNASVRGVKGSVQNELFPSVLPSLENSYTDALFTGKTTSVLDDILAVMFGFKKSGRVWKRKIWRHSAGHEGAQVEELDDYGMGAAVPGTDTAVGKDPYLEYEVFNWYRCNYTRDDDGTARVTALKGSGSYSDVGAADVGTLSMTFYWDIEPHEAEGYDILYFSDMPNEELGLVPWCEAVKADGTVLPYYIDSTFQSVMASDGTLRSQAGAAPIHTLNYAELRQFYQEKGYGYNGAGMSVNTLQVILLAVKYLTKNSQDVFLGCTNWNAQYRAAVAETGVRRVLVTESQAKNLAEDGCVSVGIAADDGALDRNQASIHSLADRVRIQSLETVEVGGVSYVAVNLDIPRPINVTTDTVLSTMPQWTGATETVLGSYDGTPGGNEAGKFQYRLKGIEYMNGQSMLASDTILVYNQDYSAGIYVAEKGTEHTYKEYETAYTKLATLFAPASGNTEDLWVADYAWDVEHGLCYPASVGGSASEGTGDKYYAKGALQSGYRTYLMNGRQSAYTDGGALTLYPWYSQWHNDWDIGSRD